MISVGRNGLLTKEGPLGVRGFCVASHHNVPSPIECPQKRGIIIEVGRLLGMFQLIQHFLPVRILSVEGIVGVLLGRHPRFRMTERMGLRVSLQRVNFNRAVRRQFHDQRIIDDLKRGTRKVQTVGNSIIILDEIIGLKDFHCGGCLGATGHERFNFCRLPEKIETPHRHNGFPVQLNMDWFSYILKHPKKNWNWEAISSNPNITWEIVQAYPKKKWDYTSLATNPNITWEIIQAHPEMPWTSRRCWQGDPISYNPTIPWEIVQSNPRRWNWRGLSANPNISWEIIQAHPTAPWDWLSVAVNPNITWDIIRSNPDKNWNEWFLYANPNLTWENFQTFHGFGDKLETNRYAISAHPNITLEIIRAHPEFNWYWPAVSQNPNITWEMIQQNHDIPWNKRGVSKNPNLTWEIVDSTPSESWVWSELSGNPMTG